MKTKEIILRCYLKTEYGYGHVRFYPEQKTDSGDTKKLCDYDSDFAHLIVSDQIDDHNGNRPGQRDYAWSTEFETHRVYLNSAKRFVKVLTAIDRKLDSYRDQFGPSATYGQYVARVAQAIGVKTIMFDSREPGFSPIELTPGESVGKIDGLVEDIAKRLRGEPVEQAA